MLCAAWFRASVCPCALPVLEIMCNESGTAFAQGAPLPTTFGIFFWGNGIHPGSLWTPSGDGRR